MGADAIGVAGGKPQVSDRICSHQRSRRQRIALTPRILGVFPMTHHVECVALLERRSFG
jgi:hypothetical protein